MAFLGALEALKARLTGRPFLYTPPLHDDVIKAWNEKLSALELQTHMQGHQTNVPVKLRSEADTTISGKKVPVHYFDVTGATQPGLTSPALTYSIIDFIPRYDGALWSSADYGGDVYCSPVEGSEEEVIDENGESLGSAARVVSTRPIEHPFDIMVEFRAYASDIFDSAMLVKYLYERFPPRHFIRVPMRDGSYRSWDMLHQDSKTLDRKEATRSGTPGLEREYVKVFTYVIEGYLDNTDQARLQQLNRTRVITATETSL